MITDGELTRLWAKNWGTGMCENQLTPKTLKISRSTHNEINEHNMYVPLSFGQVFLKLQYTMYDIMTSRPQCIAVIEDWHQNDLELVNDFFCFVSGENQKKCRGS
jgi:hypothetical protein